MQQEFSENAMLERISQDRIIATLTKRLASLNLNQCYLTAGCLFQTVWNDRSDTPSKLKDYDVFYFDESNLAYDEEDRAIQEIKQLVSDLGICVDVKNQARVHLWYSEKFGGNYPKLINSTDGIDRFLIRCTCVGLNVQTHELYAPNGCQEIWEGILRVNPLNPRRELFLAKAQDFRRRWPWLQIIDEDGSLCTESSPP